MGKFFKADPSPAGVKYSDHSCGIERLDRHEPQRSKPQPAQPN